MDILISVLASFLPLVLGYGIGQWRERQQRKGTPIEEHEHYPFSLDENDHLFFDLDKFAKAVHAVSQRRNDLAARQLIIIGQQNNVREILPSSQRKEFLKLYAKYQGDKILDDTRNYLENYKRIVHLIGDSFPDIGIEILLHNLSNPSKALYILKNNVTGRNVEAPATNLVIDLRRRSLAHSDKLNYELNIGSRRFKCTTIPIYREDFGLVGAVCINVDYNYLNEEVRNNEKALNHFLNMFLRVDMQLDENILSKHEFALAQNGKRHFRHLVG